MARGRGAARGPWNARLGRQRLRRRPLRKKRRSLRLAQRNSLCAVSSSPNAGSGSIQPDPPPPSRLAERMTSAQSRRARRDRIGCSRSECACVCVCGGGGGGGWFPYPHRDWNGPGSRRTGDHSVGGVREAGLQPSQQSRISRCLCASKAGSAGEIHCDNCTLKLKSLELFPVPGPARRVGPRNPRSSGGGQRRRRSQPSHETPPPPLLPAAAEQPRRRRRRRGGGDGKKKSFALFNEQRQVYLRRRWVPSLAGLEPGTSGFGDRV